MPVFSGWRLWKLFRKLALPFASELKRYAARANMRLSGEQIAGLGWDDAKFRGFRWDSSASDPTLIFYLALPEYPEHDFVCHWAREVECKIDYQNYVGTLFTSDLLIEKIQNGENAGWQLVIVLDRDHGEISLCCNEFELKPVSTKSAA